jgi:predicted TIM-barrel fold metal-dependent hydrolase
MMDTIDSRRTFLGSLAGLAAAHLFSSTASSAQVNAGGGFDFHHHFVSPRVMKRLAEVKRQGWDTFQKYSPGAAVEAMDKANVSRAFLSLPSPGVWLGDDFNIERTAAIDLSRDINEYGARLVSDYKGRFGLFAVLPIPDIDASLREIEYAFDTLNADGVGLLTSYGRIWMGDKTLQPVFDELNRRNAVVYSHPTDAACCHDTLPDTAPTSVEWNTDTSRAIFSMINESAQGEQAGTRVSPATRYANIRFIWSHAGGSLLGLIGRFLGGAASAENLARPVQPNSRLYHIRRFYYDTAGSANPIQMQALKSLAGPSQIVLGSDYPFGNIAMIASSLAQCGFSPDELDKVYHQNGLNILPRYRR